MLCDRRKDRAGLGGKTGSIFKAALGCYGNRNSSHHRGLLDASCILCRAQLCITAASLGCRGGEDVQLILSQRAESKRERLQQLAVGTAPNPAPAAERLRASVGLTGTGRAPSRVSPAAVTPHRAPGVSWGVSGVPQLAGQSRAHKLQQTPQGCSPSSAAFVWLSKSAFHPHTHLCTYMALISTMAKSQGLPRHCLLFFCSYHAGIHKQNSCM